MNELEQMEQQYLGMQAMLAYALEALGGTLIISQERLINSEMAGKEIQIIANGEKLQLEVSLVNSE